MHGHHRLTHIALRVKDLDTSVSFYKTYAGLKLIHERCEHTTRVGWLGNQEVNPSLVIVLLEMPYENSSQPSFDHLGLDLPSRDEVDAVATKAREDGILVMEPEEMGPIAGYLCMVSDPDGNRVEFSYGQDIESVMASNSHSKKEE